MLSCFFHRRTLKGNFWNAIKFVIKLLSLMSNLILRFLVFLVVFEQIRPESLEVGNALVHGQLLRFSVKLPQISAGQFVVMKFNVLLVNKKCSCFWAVIHIKRNDEGFKRYWSFHKKVKRFYNNEMSKCIKMILKMSKTILMFFLVVGKKFIRKMYGHNR